MNNNTLNGQDTLDGETASSSELFEAHKNLLRDIWAAWGAHRDNFVKAVGAEGHQKFPRLSTVTLTQIAATCAIDVAISEEQFLAACKANYADAKKKAIRWG